MSFFDEADEPRAARRATSPRRRRSRSARRRPPARRTIVERRAVAAVAMLIVVLLIALGVHGCQVSQRDSALTDYQSNVAALIHSSDQTGSRLFSELSRASGSATATSRRSEINQARVNADSELQHAGSIDVPSEVQPAQRYLLLTLQMRRDALADIAAEIQPAPGTLTSRDAVNRIAAEMARLNASDVLYSDYMVPAIVGALREAGVAVGGVKGVMIGGGQFLPNAQWLTPEYIALELGMPLPARSGKLAPGVHGHRMDSVSVGDTMLQTGSTNTVPDSPPPTFTCTFTNDGQNVETDVVVKVAVSGTAVSGLAIVPQTIPGQRATAEVTLNSAPPKGTYTVSATVEQVPGETVLTHNTLSFPVTFQ